MADTGSETDRHARIPRVLSIAGSDSGGGAGIQADLKAFAACGVHGMTAITAITAQSTVGVTAVEHVSPEMIVAQVKAVAEDIGVDAVKIGMLGSVDTVEAVVSALHWLRPDTPVVLDPVMVSESGAQLLERPAVAALIRRLLPRVTVVTPNLPEAHALAEAARPDPVQAARPGETAVRDQAARPGESAVPDQTARPGESAVPDHAVLPEEIDGPVDVPALARSLHALGPQVVVVTGGHRESATDVFFDGSQVVELPGRRYPGGAAHGSGCTHSSVLAARLAWDDSPLEAARAAKALASRAVRDGLAGVGAGPGPVDVLRAVE